MNVLLINEAPGCEELLQEHFANIGIRLLLAGDEDSARLQLADENVSAVLVAPGQDKSSNDNYDRCLHLKEKLQTNVPFIMMQTDLGTQQASGADAGGEQGMSSLPAEIMAILSFLPSDN